MTSMKCPLFTTWNLQCTERRFVFKLLESHFTAMSHSMHGKEIPTMQLLEHKLLVQQLLNIKTWTVAGEDYRPLLVFSKQTSRWKRTEHEPCTWNLCLCNVHDITMTWNDDIHVHWLSPNALRWWWGISHRHENRRQQNDDVSHACRFAWERLPQCSLPTHSDEHTPVEGG